MEKNAPILIVDDLEDFRQLLEISLTPTFPEMLFAENGKAAAKVLAEGPVRLIITDLDMPDYDGKWLLNHVKSAHADVPVVVLTASLSATESECLSLGAKAFLLKPFSVESLRLVIQELLRD